MIDHARYCRLGETGFLRYEVDRHLGLVLLLIHNVTDFYFNRRLPLVKQNFIIYSLLDRSTWAAGAVWSG